MGAYRVAITDRAKKDLVIIRKSGRKSTIRNYLVPLT